MLYFSRTPSAILYGLPPRGSVQGPSHYRVYDHYPCNGDGPRGSGNDAYGLLPLRILGTLVDAMRKTPRGDRGWRLCPAKRDRQPSLCACALLAAREATVTPHAKGHKRCTPTPMAMWVQYDRALRIQLESSPKQVRLNRVDNYGIFKIDYYTTMPDYTFSREFVNA